MRLNLRIVFFVVLLIEVVPSIAQDRVLIFSKTTGFRHDNIPYAGLVIKNILDSAAIQSNHLEDSAVFVDSTLAQYDAVLFLSTTGDILNNEQQQAFQRFIQSGKGFVGIHAASDTEFDWPWYGQLVGGYFASHPAVQEAKIDVLDQKHPATQHLDSIWFHRDEWYDFKHVASGLHILMTLDESTYENGKMGKFHPIAWYHNFDGGRSFYTGLGHTAAAFDGKEFQQHLLGAVRYAIGK